MERGRKTGREKGRRVVLAKGSFLIIAFIVYLASESESHSVVSYSLQPHGLYIPQNSPGQNTGVGSRSLLQGIFPTHLASQLQWPLSFVL